MSDPVHPREHLLLDVEVLEHRFDHQVRLAQRLVLQAGRDERQALLESRLGERSLAQCALIVAVDVEEAPVERLLRRLEEGDRQSGVDEAHGDAAAHRARAHDRDPTDGTRGDRFGPDREVAHPFGSASLGDQGAREVESEGHEIAVRKGIEQLCVAQLLEAHRRAGDDHVQCRFDADQPRQALGAAGAGDQYQFDAPRRWS